MPIARGSAIEMVERTYADYATAAQALDILKVRPQTLYAYVSRGLVRSIPQPGQKERLYRRDDLKRLETRSLARAGHGAVAAAAMNFGEPIISTSITEITAEGPRYRGRMAVDLARSHASFESVAHLLWTGVWHEGELVWPASGSWPELASLIEPSWVRGRSNLLDVFAQVTLHLGARRQSSGEYMDDIHILSAGQQIIQTLVGCFGLVSRHGRYFPMPGDCPLRDGVLGALGMDPTDANREAIETIMILLADHELSPATFAVRVAASTGCGLHSCIVSGICASTGALIAQLYERVHAFLDSADTASALLQQAAQLHERGMAIPGFEHPLYPHGDPRASYMLELAATREHQPPWMSEIYAFVGEMAARHGLLPRHEFGIVALTRAMGLRRETSAAVATLARMAGWLAHVQEQRMFGTVLRPRARFV
jgi:citrate synthase